MDEAWLTLHRPKRGEIKLALYGGKPVRSGPLPVMHPGGSAISDEELKAVESVLRSRSLYRFYGPEFSDVTGAFE